MKSVGFDLIDIESALPFIEASCACNGGVIGLMAILDSEKIRSWMGLESHSRVSPEEPSWDTLEAQIEKWEQLKQRGENISIATVNKVIKSESIKKLSPLLVERIYSLLFSENGRKSSQTVSVQPDKKDDIGHIICEALSEVIGLNKVDENEIFQNYGLESVSAMRLSFTLGQKLGREVRPEWLIDYPSVRALSKRINEKTRNFNVNRGDLGKLDRRIYVRSDRKTEKRDTFSIISIESWILKKNKSISKRYLRAMSDRSHL